MPIPGRPKTFGLETHLDLLRKLEWEMDGLKGASPTDPDGLVFRAFNAVVTAWHIGDWVWEDMDEGQRAALRDDWGEALNVKGDFLFALRQQNREIALCREIATASKHVEVTQSPDDAVDADLSAHGPAWRIGAKGAAIAATAPSVWRLTVRDDNQRRPLLDVLEGALAFWTEFIYQRRNAR